eukprot:505194_1
MNILFITFVIIANWMHCTVCIEDQMTEALKVFVNNPPNTLEDTQYHNLWRTFKQTKPLMDFKIYNDLAQLFSHFILIHISHYLTDVLLIPYFKDYTNVVLKNYHYIAA